MNIKSLKELIRESGTVMEIQSIFFEIIESMEGLPDLYSDDQIQELMDEGDARKLVIEIVELVSH